MSTRQSKGLHKNVDISAFRELSKHDREPFLMNYYKAIIESVQKHKERKVALEVSVNQVVKDIEMIPQLSLSVLCDMMNHIFLFVRLHLAFYEKGAERALSFATHKLERPYSDEKALGNYKEALGHMQFIKQFGDGLNRGSRSVSLLRMLIEGNINDPDYPFSDPPKFSEMYLYTRDIAMNHYIEDAIACFTIALHEHGVEKTCLEKLKNENGVLKRRGCGSDLDLYKHLKDENNYSSRYLNEMRTSILLLERKMRRANRVESSIWREMCWAEAMKKCFNDFDERGKKFNVLRQDVAAHEISRKLGNADLSIKTK